MFEMLCVSWSVCLDFVFWSCPCYVLMYSPVFFCLGPPCLHHRCTCLLFFSNTLLAALPFIHALTSVFSPATLPAIAPSCLSSPGSALLPVTLPAVITWLLLALLYISASPVSRCQIMCVCFMLCSISALFPLRSSPAITRWHFSTCLSAFHHLDLCNSPASPALLVSPGLALFRSPLSCSSAPVCVCRTE